MIDNAAVELSRLQFGLTAMYHFLFVPLTLGLSILLGIFESVYVMTGRSIWREITKYWGLLFGINFAMGVATGITMEFQFGTNWAYYSHYVGDIFGVPLAIEGLMAFFLEASFIGLFFFGWDRLSKIGHLVVTWLVALGSNLSALWILIANGWMQHPVGAAFNPASMRMEVTNFSEVLFNPVAQAKFVHTVSAGYVTGAIFVMAISAWFLLKGRNRAFAIRSMTVAASFGLASALSVVVLGDESGYTASENQKMKLAAIEAMWQTEPAPASFTAFGFPDAKAHITRDAIEVPWVMGLIGTRSINGKIPGIIPLVEANKARIASGVIAYGALEQLRHHPDDTAARTRFNAHVNDLGYGLLLKRYTDKVVDATPAEIDSAAWDTVPNVPALFWTFRLMVGCGFFFIAFFAFAFWLSAKHRLDRYSWFLRLAVVILPLPWIAAELGWFVAEHGRQPWTIDGILPTFLSASSLTAGNLWLSLGGFVVFYSVLAVVELYLMIKYIKLGPDAEAGPASPALGAPALSLSEGGR
ncbi:cytochrome ubiquinol oxidase subunit I [uncultured Methylovirgula sp.]|uniref:cytochrome ubiquinol oxidase subunit I n=1 Tax=uncultured Methylovirgula sp. TaxID=1285960 RepID=UPI0026326D21|nr:cytochrome ubiquinol oxidase subunit I [uncultured Methylovirgula sp.]